MTDKNKEDNMSKIATLTISLAQNKLKHIPYILTICYIKYFLYLMPYGKIKKILCDEYNEFNDAVLVESPFTETSRQGRYLRDVYLGLTPNNFVVAAERDYGAQEDVYNNKTLEIIALYPIHCVDLSVFKCTKRQTLKARLKNNTEIYYQLGYFKKRKIFWKIWCAHVFELKRGFKIWPFCQLTCGVVRASRPFWNRIDCLEIRKWNELNDQMEKERMRWTDKYVFLGEKRQKEDSERPIPIPGLGQNEESQLQYLKTNALVELVENYVECYRYEHKEALWEFDAYTYTGEPTSNVTYTSIMNTVSLP